jgi:hypothetical protein
VAWYTYVDHHKSRIRDLLKFILEYQPEHILVKLVNRKIRLTNSFTFIRSIENNNE